jgi:ketosteroid isomerase-like protein
MSGTEQTRALVRRYFETLSKRDWDSFGALLADE